MVLRHRSQHGPSRAYVGVRGVVLGIEAGASEIVASRVQIDWRARPTRKSELLLPFFDQEWNLRVDFSRFQVGAAACSVFPEPASQLPAQPASRCSVSDPARIGAAPQSEHPSRASSGVARGLAREGDGGDRRDPAGTRASHGHSRRPGGAVAAAFRPHWFERAKAAAWWRGPVGRQGRAPHNASFHGRGASGIQSRPGASNRVAAPGDGRHRSHGCPRLWVATLRSQCSTESHLSGGIPRAVPESSTPRNTTPPSAFANATSSPASSSVLGDSTPRTPKRTSLNSARPSSPARSWSRICSSVSNIVLFP